MPEFVHIKGCVAFEHVIDSARQFMRQDGQRFALAMLVFQAGQMLWPCRIIPEEQHGRFGKGPLEARVPDFFARGALAFARGFPGTLDQAAVGDEILHPGKAVNIMNFIEHDQGQDFPHPRDGTQAVEGGGVVLLGGFHNR